MTTPVGVQNRHNGPVILVDELREDQIHFVFKSEDQAQDAEHRSIVVDDAKRIDQRFLPHRNEIGFAEAFHVTGTGPDRLADDRIKADGGRFRIVKPRHDAAGRIEQNNVGIDRILANILAEPGAQGFQRVVLIGRIPTIAQEGADVLITREKSDIGGPFKKVSDQDIDRDLGFGARVLKTFLEPFHPQLVEQIGCEVAEGVARIADVDPGARQLPEQAEIVPDRLQLLQDPAVFLRHRHMRDDRLQPGIQIDSLEAVCHGKTGEAGRESGQLHEIIVSCS